MLVDGNQVGITLLDQERDQVLADKACGAGDDDFF
jgi:hypothetical protein